jgi:hypothetical protein
LRDLRKTVKRRYTNVGNGETILSISTRNHGVKKVRVDTADVPLLRGRSWYFKTSGKSASQVNATIGGNTISVAGFLLGARPNESIIYHNGDSLDCRRKNIALQVKNTYQTDQETGITSLTIACEAGNFTVLVDAPDVEVLSEYKWKARILKSGTVAFMAGSSRTENAIVLSHCILGDVPAGCRPRHVNGNRFDFRRDNLSSLNECGICESTKNGYLIVEHDEHGQLVVIIDVEDVDLVRPHRWYAKTSEIASTGCVYFLSEIEGKTVMLHRFIMGNPSGVQIDHKDPNNTLDNRKTNLRMATSRQNTRNRRKFAPAFSKFKGVSIDRASGQLVVSIRTDHGRIKRRFRLDQEIEAAMVYDMLAIKYHGEFALLNFPIVVAELNEEAA